jgi:hypothetical protein
MKQTIIAAIALIIIMINLNNCFAGNIYFSNPVNNQIITGYYSSDKVEFNLFFGADFSAGSAGAYAELTTENGHYYRDLERYLKGNNMPTTWEVTGGPHTWTLTLHEAIGRSDYEETAHQTITFYVKFIINAANNFGGGSIILEGANVASGASSNPKLIGESVSVGAIDQNDGAGYNRIWNSSGTNISIWQIRNSPINGATPRNYSYTVASNDNHATLVADLKKICNVTFQNTGHQITINGNGYSSPGTFQSVEGNPITVSTDSYYNNNGIDYNFFCWTDGVNNYSSPITVSSHSTFTAKYIGIPSNASKNQSYGATFNAPIVVHWTDNPNVNVNQYQIYRKIGDNGTPAIIGTVGRGVQQFTDYDYNRVSDPKQTRLFYDVREYYSIEQTYSPQSWILVFGSDFYKIKENEKSMVLDGEIPTEYKLDNYPNPFNPVTVINYQLPQDGFVTLKVYDMLGKEVATVVNEYKNAGYYKVNFDAGRLTSGVYIYRISSNNFFLTKKMLLMK